MSVATLTPAEGASPLEGTFGMGIVGSVLATLGLPQPVVQRLVEVATTAQSRAEGTLDRQDDDELLDALSASSALQGQLEATSIEITRALSRRAAERLLGEAGCTSPEELGARARQSWRRQTKLAVASELQALLGLGVQESYDMIALANAPAAVREPITDGMTERGARWGEARKFWDEAGDLDHEDAADVAEALFGKDPDKVVRERLEPDEEGTDPAQHDGHPEHDQPNDETGTGQPDGEPESEQSDGGPESDGGSDSDGGADSDGASDSDGGADSDGASGSDGGAGAEGGEDADQADDEAGGDPTTDGTAAADGTTDNDGKTGTRKGRVKDCPWPTKTFARELKREVAARRKEADQHRRARRRCGMSVSVGADGLSSITFTGETIQVMGMAQRVEDIARQVRREGSESNLDTLRFRTGAMLLMHGTLPDLPVNPAPATGDETLLDPDQLLTSNDLERIASVLTAQPAVELQIITPLDAIIGADALDFLRGRHSCTCSASEPASTPVSPDDPSQTGDPQTGDPRTGDQRTGDEGTEGRRAVGEVLGPQSAFLTAEHLRELLTRPRSTLRRLVTDPVSGFLVHRESRGYRPDAALKAFVRARDVMCKGVGCTHPAFYADLDHVINYPEGPTSAANLNLDCRREHMVKTYGLTKCAMDATGVVRWTTFFGRMYTSGPHDYLQYSPTLPPRTSSRSQERPDGDHPDPQPDRASTQQHGDATPEAEPQNVRDLIVSGRFFRGMRQDEAERLAGRLIYAALAHRAPRSRLRASDDGPWDDSVPEDPHAWLASVPIRLRHTTPGGQWRNGPPPDQPTPEDILVEEGLAERADRADRAKPAERADRAERAEPAEPKPGSPEDRDPWEDIPPF